MDHVFKFLLLFGQYIYIGPTFKLSTYFFLFTLERRQLGVTICVSGTCSCCSETRIFDYIDQS